jgi:hypothetical protein
VAAAQELLIDILMARAAIRRRHRHVDDKSVVVPLLLSFSHLVAIQAVQAFLRMSAHLELVHHGILRVEMAFGAFPAGTNERRARLLDNRSRPARVDEIGRNDQCRGDDNGNEDSSKTHNPLGIWAPLYAERFFPQSRFPPVPSTTAFLGVHWRPFAVNSMVLILFAFRVLDLHSTLSAPLWFKSAFPNRKS